jgi:hypothetical protein
MVTIACLQVFSIIRGERRKCPLPMAREEKMQVSMSEEEAINKGAFRSVSALGCGILNTSIASCDTAREAETDIPKLPSGTLCCALVQI